MKKRKYSPTRKHKAIVRTMIAAALLTLAFGANFYGLFPSSGLRALEETCGTGKTDVITKTFEKAVFSEIYLAENENVLMLAMSKFYVSSGWQGRGMSVTDKDPDAVAGVETGFWSLIDADSDERIFYIFGKVTDASIMAVNAGVADADRTVLQSAGTDDFIEKDGSRYFMIRINEFSQVPVHSVIIEGFDQNSRMIFQTEIEQEYLRIDAISFSR
ncbi:MAG: hypothetical protein EOM54_01030 [Clostridia bacterium]|nr:hypothetical protein [Clostridia bacterium]